MAINIGILIPLGNSKHSREAKLYNVININDLLVKMPIRKPYADTRLPRFIETQVLALRPLKSQADIAAEAGFTNPNMISMIKSGGTRLPIDRVPALAKALDVDPRRLLQLAVEQLAGATAARTFDEIFGTIVTLNEIAWLKELREASDHGDPALTTRARSSLRAIFGK